MLLLLTIPEPAPLFGSSTPSMSSMEMLLISVAATQWRYDTLPLTDLYLNKYPFSSCNKTRFGELFVRSIQ
eukprot:15103298-Ditylum_brightwellii.AAC.1